MWKSTCVFNNSPQNETTDKGIKNFCYLDIHHNTNISTEIILEFQDSNNLEKLERNKHIIIQKLSDKQTFTHSTFYTKIIQY